jgi:hypothetical protein
MSKKLNYYSRNFADFRTELINFVRQYYPDIFSDFNDSSIGTMLIELNAGVADVLAYQTDRMFQETQLDYAQEKRSLLAIARTYGLKIPNKRPSITILDWSCTVPVLGDTFDVDYAPLIRRGSQAIGAGRTFEAIEDIDFSSPYSSGGIPNRLVIPNIDTNGNILNYTLVKREIALNGVTKIFRYDVNTQDSRPFFELYLPDSDVLNVEQVISLQGTNYTTVPSLTQFLDFNNSWYEVQALAENKIFVEDTTRVSDRAGVKPGRWVNISRKFITEFTDKGFCKLIFGAGSVDTSTLLSFCAPSITQQVQQIGNFINSSALGEVLKPNTTLFIKYRIGGGASTNLGPNIINTLGLIDATVTGPNSATNATVRNSITVNNPIPALGGADALDIEQIRALIRYNFTAQNRCVTIKDYKSRILLMPGEYGVPYRTNVVEEQNKIVVSLLTLGTDGKLSNSSTNTLKENIAEYLADYRMLNDFVVIKDGKIYNLKFEFDLYIDSAYSKSEIVTNVVNTVYNYMNITQRDMGENIYLGQLIESINNIGGVLNVIDIRVYNKVGGNQYSLNEVSQPLIDPTTRQINLLGEFTLFADPDSMFEIKYPEKDIVCRIKS